ncbi:MAG: hypothetical protein VKK04_19370 [Synechococcales bacterium]|nr:hypothetical protein [Synechococcales bacterium]
MDQTLTKLLLIGLAISLIFAPFAGLAPLLTVLLVAIAAWGLGTAWLLLAGDSSQSSD